ncbi:hypothetical protein [Streptomyces sp. NPDC012746]|uniref:hypothetical protein n=1 Tax=Streptomyces sp. NPDC012746 TaxID=3364845 RepID=UPI003695A7A0
METDEEAVVTGETGEVGVGFRMGFQAGGLLIEHRQRQRIRAIQRYRAPARRRHLAAVRAGQRLGPRRIVTLLVDSGLKYLSNGAHQRREDGADEPPVA